MRKPRDLDKFCSKADALAFVDELREMVARGDDDMLYRIKADFRQWHPSWAKAGKDAA